ncbi:MAG: methionine synthase, partial [Spirochaetaceae bacterium]|nr:methionine synthase [Spirochaetaceae bacterium]
MTGAEIISLNDYPLAALLPHFDWEGFFRRWDVPPVPEGGARAAAREALEKDARELLAEMVRDNLLRARGVLRFFPARSRDEAVMLYDPSALADAAGAVDAQPEPVAVFQFPRVLRKRRAGLPNPCLADFILPETAAAGRFDTLGLFALSTGCGLAELREAAGEGSYRAILAASLADNLVEAWSEETHARLATWTAQLPWRSGLSEQDGRGIRPAFGYPCCPSHEDKRLAFRLLDAPARCGLSLTETAMIYPTASV